MLNIQKKWKYHTLVSCATDKMKKKTKQEKTKNPQRNWTVSIATTNASFMGLSHSPATQSWIKLIVGA